MLVSGQPVIACRLGLFHQLNACQPGQTGCLYREVSGDFVEGRRNGEYDVLLFQRFVAKRTGSLIVSADALHGLGDVGINIGVIVALLLSTRLDAPFVDPVIGILLAFVLLQPVDGAALIAVYFIVHMTPFMASMCDKETQ